MNTLACTHRNHCLNSFEWKKLLSMFNSYSCLCMTIVMDNQRLIVIMICILNVIEVNLNGNRKTCKKLEFELDKA